MAISATQFKATTLPVEFALDLSQHDVAPIPIIPSTKKPACKWVGYQFHPPGFNEILRLFNKPNLNIAAIGGAASNGLVICDCDDQRTLEWLDARLHVPTTWIIGSRRGGHVYLRLPLPVRSTVHPQNRALQINAQGKYALTIGSTHPSGHRYSFLREAAKIIELDDYGAIPQLTLIPSFDAARRLVPVEALRLLRGYTPEKYKSRSEADCAVCAIMIKRGFSQKDVVHIFKKFSQFNPESKYLEIQIQEGEARASRYLDRTYRAAKEFLETHPSQADAYHQELATLANSFPWTGRSGQYDRVTYSAHLETMRISGKLIYSASVRDLAERAGISKSTAAKSNARLLGAGLVCLEQPATCLRASFWSLSVDGIREMLQGRTYYQSPQLIGDIMSVHATKPMANSAHDAFRYRGGKTACEVYNILSAHESGLRANQIAAKTGRHRATISRILPKMSTLNLVYQHDQMWFANSSVDFDKLAKSIGTAGKAEVQQQKHRRERAEYRKKVARAIIVRKCSCTVLQKLDGGEYVCTSCGTITNPN